MLDKSWNSHPYEAEITALMESPPLELKCVTENLDLKMTESYVWVETETQLKELVEVLSRVKISGVDTEQHSLRSFLGFTALIQVKVTDNQLSKFVSLWTFLILMLIG